jgi:predicted phosphodiesterase
MRLWVLSDLHMDLTKGWDLPSPSERPPYDVFVVAGDLISRMERGVRWLAERLTDRPVIYVPGNHEGYGADIDRTVEKAKEAAAGTNIHVLENDTVVVGAVRFLGTTLWTDFELFGAPAAAMRAAGDRMNDYRRIRIGHYARPLRPSDTLLRHSLARSYLAAELATPFAGPTVVVTHHGVDRACSRPQYADDIITAAYLSDLTELIDAYQPRLWIYGHTHQSDDRMVGRTRLLSNAKGYGPWPPDSTWENPHFDPTLTVEID